MRTVGSVIVTAVAAMALVTGVAGAHDNAIPNSVTLTKAKHYGPGVWEYKGRVRSSNSRCERHREVQVYRADVNPEVRLFTTRTGASGRWKRKGPVLPNGAKVYALIETRVIVSNGAHDHICKVDRSPVRTVPYP